MSRVVLTFDYELFLGEDSGTAQRSILEPTDAILELLERYQAKAIFFVDATYLLALKRFGHKDLEPIASQLRKIVTLGSSVELHLHPQWLDAKPKGKRWVFESFERYRLHALSFEEIGRLFEEGIGMLESITGQKISAFRAGGWSVQPFDMLKPLFLQYDIKLDMSVLSGFYEDALPMHYYDFRNIPQKSYYRFSEDVCIEDPKGDFLEVPVTTFYMPGYDLLLNTLINKFHKERYFGDGKGMGGAYRMEGNLLKRIFSQNLRKATIENQSRYMFLKSLKKIADRELLSYVMHPKTLNPISLENFATLIKRFETYNSQDLLREYL